MVHKSTLELAIPSLLLVLWLASLGFFLTLDISHFSYPLIVFAILLRTFLHTGLFVIAHDAMHGSAIPHNRILNSWLGTLAIGLYAFLPYGSLRKKHELHHRYPTSPQDPDYHEEVSSNLYFWYGRFMQSYLRGNQWVIVLIGITIVSSIATAWLDISIVNLLLFWLVPLVLSSMQLFYFGTYLPHRRTAARERNSHHATSTQLSTFWSLLSCYHFGYHWEHHAYPSLPWYDLPAVRYCTQITSMSNSNIRSDKA